jgi:PAS domain S-box-containing protein
MDPLSDAPHVNGPAPTDDKLDAGEGPGSRHPVVRSGARLLQDVIDSLTDGVVVADLQGRFVLFNPAAERMLGIGPVGVPASEWSASYGCFRDDMVTPFPSEELPLARAIKGETTHDCAVFIRNTRVPEGIWLSINASPIRDEAGRLAGGVAIFRDDTAKRRELAHIGLLSTVVEQTADAVVVTDREGLIEYVNPAVEKTTGFSARELVGKTPRVFRSGAHDTTFYEGMWGTLRAGRVFRDTLINRKKNGAIFYSEQTIAPVRDATGTIVHYVSVAKDITDRRKAAESESRHLLARAVQQRLFPAAPPPGCGFELGGAVYTADKTGGDYFDYIPLSDATMAVVVGDVSGHAFDSALIMAETRAYLRSIAQTACWPAIPRRLSSSRWSWPACTPRLDRCAMRARATRPAMSSMRWGACALNCRVLVFRSLCSRRRLTKPSPRRCWRKAISYCSSLMAWSRRRTVTGCPSAPNGRLT